MDYLPEQGLNEETQNLPTLNFIVNHNSMSQLGIDVSDLRISYRYKWSRRIQQFTDDWHTIQENSDNSYMLPIAYQTLLPESVPNRNMMAAYIIKTTPDDKHQIDIKLSDSHNNEKIFSFPFSLKLYSSPIYLSNCKFDDNLEKLSLRNNTLHHAYIDHEYKSFTADILFDNSLPENSMIKRGSIYLNISNNNITSTISRLTHRVSAAASTNVKNENKCTFQHSMYGIETFRKWIWETTKECEESLAKYHTLPYIWDTEEKLITKQKMTSRVVYKNSNKSVPTKTIHKRKVYLLGDPRQYTIEISMQGYLKYFNQSDINATHLPIMDVANTSYYKIGSEQGLQITSSHNGSSIGGFKQSFYIHEMPIVREHFIRRINIQQPPLNISYDGSDNGMPNFINIKKDGQTCGHYLNIQWDTEEDRPIIYK